MLVFFKKEPAWIGAYNYEIDSRVLHSIVWIMLDVSTVPEILSSKNAVEDIYDNAPSNQILGSLISP